MAVDQFWDFIAASQPVDGLQPERLLGLLRPLPCEEKQAFSLTFRQFSQDAYRWDVWSAAYLYAGGCGDDSFMDFRSGLISQGREVYETILNNPDQLATAVQLLPEDVDLFFEDFGYIHSQALKEDHCPPSGIRTEANTHPLSANLEGNDWDFDDEQEMQRRCPRLWAMYGDV